MDGFRGLILNLYAFMCRGVGAYGPHQNFCFEIHLAQIQLFIKLQGVILFYKMKYHLKE